MKNPHDTDVSSSIDVDTTVASITHESNLRIRVRQLEVRGGEHVDRSIYMCISMHYRPTSIPLKIPDQESRQKLVGILACWLPGPLVSQARHFC